MTKLIQGKFQEAFQFTSSICQKIEGCHEPCYIGLFRESLYLGEFEQAEQYYKQWQTTSSPDPWLDQYNYLIGYVYHRLGRTQEAEKIFDEQIKKIKFQLNKGQKDGWGNLPNYLLVNLSGIYAFQGDNEALRYLAEYAEKGFTLGMHDFILIDPFFESIRDDPKFKAIVKQAQDEKAALRAQVREMEERGELELL